MLTMYAINSKTNNWWKHINVIIWGASAKPVGPMKKAIVFIMIMFPGFFNLCKAQDFLRFKDTITVNTLRKHIEILCDKESGGRKFATQGEKNAANYIHDEFIKSGLNCSAKGT